LIRIENIGRYDGPGVYIGRKLPERKAGYLQNPFKITKFVDRDECIRRFEDYFNERVLESGTFAAYVKGLAMQAIKDELVLICCCRPERCHGDVIADYIRYHTETVNGRWYSR